MKYKQGKFMTTKISKYKNVTAKSRYAYKTQIKNFEDFNFINVTKQNKSNVIKNYIYYDLPQII